MLGLAPPRSQWFTDVSRWATAGTLPIEFIRCLSAEELRARLLSGRQHSAALLDATHAATDRDLLAACSEARCTPIVLSDATANWIELGAAEVLPRQPTAEALGDRLATLAHPVDPADDVILEVQVSSAAWRGALVTVLGTGGCGTSTVALGLAEYLSASESAGRVLLADLARRSDQALLHATGTVLPALPELVERCRTGTPEARHLHALTFEVATGGYDLLIGMRRSAEWTALRPRAVEAAVEAMRRAWDLVVADTDADLEGQSSTGSVDVEERNALARTACATADAVVVVTRPGLTGLTALVRTMEEVTALGVEPSRVVPVVNRTPRGTSQREVAAAWPTLTRDPALRPPVVIPIVRSTEANVRDRRRVPSRVITPIARSVRQVLDVSDTGSVAQFGDAERIAPGSLGRWSGDASESGLGIDGAAGDAA